MLILALSVLVWWYLVQPEAINPVDIGQHDHNTRTNVTPAPALLDNRSSEQGMRQGTQNRGFGNKEFRRAPRTKRSDITDRRLKLIMTSVSKIR